MKEFKSNEDHIPLLATVTEEQLLDFCLYHAANTNSDEQHWVAQRIIATYAVNELGKDGKIFTEEEVYDRCAELITDYALTTLVNKGMLDIDMSGPEIKYTLSEEGKKHVPKNDSIN